MLTSLLTAKWIDRTLRFEIQHGWRPMKITGLTLALSMMAGSAQAADCAFDGPPLQAIVRALTDRDSLTRKRLRAVDPVQPVIGVFDLRCQYLLTPSGVGAYRLGDRAFDVRATAHGGTIDFSDGDLFPVGKVAFATYGETGGPPTFVIALPEVWAADSADSRDPNLLFMAVFMHEFSHVQHMSGI